MEIVTKNSQQTKKIGRELAKEVLASRADKEGALVFALKGELGSGKTTFIQGFGRGLGIREKITSPSFLIMKRFEIPSPSFGFEYLYHFDCYRIKSRDLLGLDFEEIVSQKQNVLMIEWADRVKTILPKKVIWLKFEYLGQNHREIKLILK